MAQSKKKKQTRRYAVVVMGMHRSGTSALAGVLARLGCDTPNDLMEAKPMNAKGFYESDRISHNNEELMQSAGSSWFTWQEFNKPWFESPKAEEFHDLALENLTETYGNSRLLVLKDPRMCLLVPFWEAVLADAGYTPKYLHTHRHPFEVAQSLYKWAGYDHMYGQLLWLRYVLEAEAATRGKTRFFTSYDHLMTDWLTVAQRSSESLGLNWPSFSDRTNAEIDEFLDGELHHMRARDLNARDGQRLSPWVAETFEIMQRWAADGEMAADWETLDSIREQFNTATPVFSASVETGRRDALALQVKEKEVKQATSQAQSAQTEGAELRRIAEQAQAQVQALNAAQEKALAERAEIETKLQSAQTEGAEIRRIAEQAQAQVQALNAAQEKALAERAEIETKLQSAQTLDAELRRIAEQEQAQVRTLKAERELARTDRAAVEAQLDVAHGELDNAQTALANLERETGDLKHRKDTLESELRQRSHEAEQVGQQLRDAQIELQRLARELAEAATERDGLVAEKELITRTFRVEKLKLEEELRNDFAATLQRHREREDAAQMQLEAVQTALDLARENAVLLTTGKADLQKSLDIRDAETKQLESQLADAGNHVASLTEALQTAESERKALAAERETFLRSLRNEKASNKRELEEKLASALRELHKTTATEIDHVRKEQELTIKRQHDAEANVQEFLNSTSWRITAPLRRIVTMYRNLRN